MAKVFHSKIITANDLMSGEVIFMTSNGWSTDYKRAILAETPEQVEVLLAKAEAQPAKAVGAYAVDTKPDAKGINTPFHNREVIRLREGSKNQQPLAA